MRLNPGGKLLYSIREIIKMKNYINRNLNEMMFLQCPNKKCKYGQAHGMMIDKSVWLSEGAKCTACGTDMDLLPEDLYEYEKAKSGLES